MSNQLSGKFVNVGAFEVVELLSREIEDNRANDHRDVDATAVEYFSVHDWPPIVACEGRQMLRLLVYDSEENRNYVHAEAPRKGDGFLNQGRQIKDRPIAVAKKSPADGSGKLTCINCHVVMSRRLLKKPDSKTGLTEATYRCPKCGAMVNRWIKD